MADSTVSQLDNTSDKGEAVRGVGQLHVKTPRSAKLKNGVLFGVLVVFCFLIGFIMIKAKNRRKKQVEQAVVIKAGHGSAAQQEIAMVDGLKRNGQNVGDSHGSGQVSAGAPGRRSLLDGDAAKTDASMPPLRYTPTGTSVQSDPNQVSRPLTPEEAEMQKEYELEQQALRSPMVASVGNSQLQGGGSQTADQMLAANDALIKHLEQAGSQSPDAMVKVANALLNRNPAAQDGMKSPSLVSVNDYDSQNKQGDKENFGTRVLSKKDSDYQSETRVPALGPYEVKAGWLIPAVLEGELTSDLPGTVRAHVRENVYDSVTGHYLLIPQGSRLIGEYNSHIGYGQKGLQAVFTRVIFPDGSSLDLESDPGVTNLGSAGLRDKVDEHWKRLMGGALLTSLFAAGIEISQGQNGSVLQSQSVGQQVGAAVGQQLGEVGTEITRRNLNIQPTLRMRPGYRFFVSVDKDISFPAPYSAVRTVSDVSK